MGNGGTNFRLRGRLACALGAAIFGACRAQHETLELRTPDEVAPDPGLEASPLVGHRFGRWLEVEPEPGVLVPLENACLLERMGAAEEAIEVLGEAIENRSDVAALFEARGALYLATGFPRAASGDFQRAVALAPERAQDWYGLGHTYEALTLSRQALEALERAQALGLDTAELHLSLARSYRALGRRGMSAREYELAIARLTRPTTELLVEAAMLASEERESVARVQALSGALERGEARGEDTGLVLALLEESRGEPAETVASFLRAMEVDREELRELTHRLLLALQLDDAETRARVAAQACAAQTDPVRRRALEQLLSPGTR